MLWLAGEPEGAGGAHGHGGGDGDRHSAGTTAHRGGQDAGELGLTQDNVRLRRHAIQARITMMPGKGEVLDAYEEPVGEGVRCDSAGWYAGFRPNKMYDPLVGKVRMGFLMFCSFVGSLVRWFFGSFFLCDRSQRQFDECILS